MNIENKIDLVLEKAVANEDKIDLMLKKFDLIFSKLDEHDKKFNRIFNKLDGHDKKFDLLFIKVDNLEKNIEDLIETVHFIKDNAATKDELQDVKQELQAEFRTHVYTSDALHKKHTSEIATLHMAIGKVSGN